MKRRTIRIDWDALEQAFNNRNEELVYYLDTVTGRVHLEDEGGAHDLEEEDEELGGESAPGPSPAGDSTRLFIDPPSADVEAGWMGEFVAGANDLNAGLAEELRRALQAASPVVAFREVLRDRREGRDRWFAFRSEQIRSYIESWLDEHGVYAAGPPPWREE
jgi:hypothetical protein